MFLYNRCFSSIYSLSISTTWSWFAVHINWFTKVTSLCSTRSLWPCGQPPTTATVVATLLQLWCSRMWIHENPNCSVPCLMQSESFLQEPQRPTSSESKIIHAHSVYLPLFLILVPHLKKKKRICIPHHHHFLLRLDYEEPSECCCFHDKFLFQVQVCHVEFWWKVSSAFLRAVFFCVI